jgi:hypothetical protein
LQLAYGKGKGKEVFIVYSYLLKRRIPRELKPLTMLVQILGAANLLQYSCTTRELQKSMQKPAATA